MTKPGSELFVEMNEVVRHRVPKWKVIPKKESTFHKILSFLPPLLFFRKAYMQNFWTTIGYTAAYPEGAESDWDTIAHEGLHAQQAKKWNPFFMGFLYLFPQSLFLPLAIVLGLLLGAWWWLAVPVAILPWPAPWRMWWELKAYQISVMLWEWQWGRGTDTYISDIARRNFAGGSYYFMWPFPGWIRKKLKEGKDLAARWPAVEKKDPYLNGVYSVVKRGGRLARKYR